MNFNHHFSFSNFLATSLALCVFVTVSLAMASSIIGSPQEDDTEALVLQYGPNPALFPTDSLQSVVEGWKWQAELSEKQQELIGKTRQEWQLRLEDVQRASSNLQAQLAKSGLSYPVDIRSVHKIDEEIRTLEGDLIGLTAKLKQLKGEAKNAESELQFERESMRMEVDLLSKKLDMLRQEYGRVEQLYKAKAISEHQLADLKVQVAELETTMHNGERQLQMIESRIERGMSADILAVVEQQTMLNNRLQELIEKKATIEKLQPVQEIETLKAKAAVAQRMIEMAQIRKFELQLENIRNLALIELAQQRIADFKEDKQPDDEDQ